jgi:signal transduction histidine kinase
LRKDDEHALRCEKCEEERVLSRTDSQNPSYRRYAPAMLAGSWRKQSLARQFLWAGSAFTVSAMLLVGLLVTKLIEETVTRNAATSTALYVDSVIAPLLPDMAKAEMLDEASRRALDETLNQGALGKRLLTFRIWSRAGQILYSNDVNQIGQRFPPSEDLKAALGGRVIAEFNEIDDVESVAERETGLPLLEIYSPVRQPWSGEVVAITEFYERADELEHDLFRVRVQSWSAVAAATLLFFFGLSAIVLRGSRTITDQSVELRRRIEDLSHLLGQNRALKARIQRASAATAALNESYLRKLGADLHDGPAQLVAFAALRIDSGVLLDAQTSPERRQSEVRSIKDSLDEAMREIREICTGHVLPHIEAATLPAILQDLAASHRERFGPAVAIRRIDTPGDLPAAAKICIYRFVQETLNNGFKHADGKDQWLEVRGDSRSITVVVGDAGPGFSGKADNGGVGLAGIRSRVESLGGSFAVRSNTTGATVTMTLPLQDMEKTA